MIEQLIEYREWGLNSATGGAIGVALLTFIELYALWIQGSAVWKKRSGTSLSVFWIAYVTFLSTATFSYGFEISSGVLMWNGASAAILSIYLLAGVWKYKSWSMSERAIVLLCVALPFLMFTSQRDVLYAAATTGIAVPGVAQLLELRGGKNRGVVEIRFLGAYLLLAIFWITFGIAIGQWAIWAPQIPLGTVSALTILQWLAL